MGSAPFDFGVLLVFLSQKPHTKSTKFHTHATATKCLTYGTKRMI